MRKIVAIGGGENGRTLDDGTLMPYETETMDREIIRLTGKKRANFLFLAHSQSLSLETQKSYYETMKRIYEEKFGCNCRNLKSIELRNVNLVRKKLEWADIIYEGGGDTLEMIKLWKSTGFDQLLYEAWNKGKVMCGVSAGACCWFKSCNSDFLNRENGQIEFTSVDCLNWLNAHLTPHCDEKGRYEATKEQLRENSLVGIMLSNCSALEIIDNKYKIITSEPQGRNIKKAFAIKIYWDKDEYKQEKIPILNKFESLNKLLNKEQVIDYEDER